MDGMTLTALLRIVLPLHVPSKGAFPVTIHDSYDADDVVVISSSKEQLRK
jgi:hypothetical protein